MSELATISAPALPEVSLAEPQPLTTALAIGSILVDGICPKTNRICITPRRCVPTCKKMGAFPEDSQVDVSVSMLDLPSDI